MNNRPSRRKLRRKGPKEHSEAADLRENECKKRQFINSKEPGGELLWPLHGAVQV